MIKYAKIEDNIVVNTIVCDDSEIHTLPGFHVKVTESTNNAQIGYEYISEKNKFKSPQPYPSWVLNEDTLVWECPVEIPEGAEISPFGTVIGYVWNEDSQSWAQV